MAETTPNPDPVEGATPPTDGGAPATQPMAMPPLDGKAVGPGGEQANSIDLLGDVDLNVKVELGRTEMLVEDVLQLADGAVVELDKLAGDPVDVYVNQRLIARGEVLVLNDNFCIRISEIVADLEGEDGAAIVAQQQDAAAQSAPGASNVDSPTEADEAA